VISTEETEDGLRAALSAAGFNSASPEPLIAWQAFRAFAAVPVAAASDDFLFQCGVYDFTGVPRFHWNLTRQFTHDENGEYVGMEQLQLTILYEPSQELTAVETNLWSIDCASMDDWFAQVEALPEFRVVAGRRPVGCEIFQENV
jgi:hypothetical protein